MNFSNGDPFHIVEKKCPLKKSFFFYILLIVIPDETDIYTRISSFLPWIEKNSKIEENADSITWESILIVTSLLIISILIGVFSVKLAKNRLKISQTPTATTLPTVSSISNDYASNLQLPQGHVPRIASVPTIPSPVTPPPSYEHLFPDKP